MASFVAEAADDWINSARTAAGSSESQLNTAYTSARAGFSLAVSPEGDDTELYVGQMKEGLSFAVREAFLSFDTSSIPDDATIVDVDLIITGGSFGPAVTDTFEARLFDWSTSVTTADWIAGANLGNHTLVATFDSANWASGVASTWVENGTAFRTGINKSGVTRLVLSQARHRLGTRPTGVERMLIEGADGPTPPQLVVTYTVPVGKTGELKWNVAAIAALQSSARWNVLATTSKDTEAIWNVLTSVGAERDLVWDTKAAVGKSVDLVWNDRSAVAKEIDLVWNVASTVAVGRAVELLWNVLEAVGSERDLVWNDRAVAGGEAQAIWNVLAPVGASLEVLWAVRAAVGMERQLLWNDLSGVVVGRQVQLVWNLRSVAGKDLAVRWRALETAAREIEVLWRALTPVGIPIGLRWHIRRTVGGELELVWNLRSLVATERLLRWKVAAEPRLHSPDAPLLHTGTGPALDTDGAPGLTTGLSEPQLTTSEEP